MAPIQVFVQTRRPHRSHGYYCAICPFSSGGNIIQKKKKKKKPYADYDLRPRPMAWAQVTRSKTRGNIFMSLLDHAYKGPFANMKMECQRWPETPFIMGRSGTEYVAMVTELFKFKL